MFMMKGSDMTAKTASALIALNGYAFLVIALLWATAPFLGGGGPGAVLLDILDWPPDGAGAPLSPQASWLSAIGAGLTAFLAVITLTIAAPAVAQEDRATAQRVAGAVMTWFAIDSAGSIASGVASNAVFNALFLVLYLAPLLLWKGRAATAQSR
jgi:hypothetical protein